MSSETLFYSILPLILSIIVYIGVFFVPAKKKAEEKNISLAEEIVTSASLWKWILFNIITFIGLIFVSVKYADTLAYGPLNRTAVIVITADFVSGWGLLVWWWNKNKLMKKGFGRIVSVGFCYLFWFFMIVGSANLVTN